MNQNNDILQPWQKTFYKSYGIIRLHEEISDFCEYVQPTPLEDAVRNHVLNKVKSVLATKWPLIEVHLFGSFATGLYLPTSDIDIVVFGKWKKLPLWDVEKLLQQNCISKDIRVIDKASVPIVKFIDEETGYQVDISFNKDNGIKSIPMIKDYLKRFSNLKKLYMVLKQFMLQRDLNEVWTGGISSYCLMLLCISFLQNYNRNYNGEINLGCLLMEFFELYGRCFNYFNSAIYVTKSGGYRIKLDKSVGEKSSIITIDDPIDKDNDVAKSCYGLFNIRHAFSHAYCLLYSKVAPICMIDNNGDCEIPMNQSILGSIINLSKNSIVFRQRIQSEFARFVNFEAAKLEFRLPVCESLDISSDWANETVTPKVYKRRSPRKSGKAVNNLPMKSKQPKKINKARDLNDLVQWSNENVFKNSAFFQNNI